MRAYQLGWIALVGMSRIVTAGGCAAPGTYPAEAGAGGVGGTPECLRDEECEDKSVAACHKPVCADGICSEEPDDTLAPPDDGNPCTTDTCVNGEETYTNNDEPCGSNPSRTHCEGGKCIGCTVATDCAPNPETECKVWSCSKEMECIATNGKTNLFDDPMGDCTKRSCSAAGMLVVEEDLMDVPADDGNECTKAMCQGINVPVHMPQVGQPCGGDSGGPTCVDGEAKEQDKCDAMGDCVTGEPSECAPYVCGDTACKTSCAMQEDCGVTAYCDGSQSKCLAKKDLGATCVSGDECATTFCPADDQVCCASACSLPCKSCNVGGAAGTCSNLAKGVTDKCQAGQVCNAAGQCTNLGNDKAVGQSCSSSSDCFNHQSGGLSECINGLCRLHVGEVCDPSKPHECDTNLCDPATHTCQECTADNDCPAMACDIANKRCYLAMGGVCGATADCTPGKTCVSNVCQ